MINLIKGDRITKVRWEIKIQVLVDKENVQSFDKVKIVRILKVLNIGADGVRGGEKDKIRRRIFEGLHTPCINSFRLSPKLTCVS